MSNKRWILSVDGTQSARDAERLSSKSSSPELPSIPNDKGDEAPSGMRSLYVAASQHRKPFPRETTKRLLSALQMEDTAKYVRLGGCVV